MIGKLDWYILRKFFTTFIFCMLLFTVIAVAVDSSEKTDDFVKSGLSTSQIITEYYFGFVPWIWGLLYPLFVFIAVIFFTSKMALNSEVIAILASGTTYNRWLRPYIIGGTFFAIILFFANAFTLPRATAIRNSFKSTYVDSRDKSRSSNQFGCWNCIYKRLDSVTYAGLKNYDTGTRSAERFFMDKVRNNKVYYNLRAQRIEWDTAKRNWKLTQVMERTIDSMKETLREVPELHLKLALKPEELVKDEYIKDKLTTPELEEYIRVEEQRLTEGLNALKVEKFRRTASCFTVLLLTMIGAILAGRKTRGGSGLHLALGIIIAAVFIISDRFSTVFSVKSNLPPLIAAWLPNAVFTMIAYYLYRKAPK
jgi:lipopolysaccharide export system permease protein